MISPAYQCGCPEQDPQQNNCDNQKSNVHPRSANLKSLASNDCNEKDDDSCGCGSDSDEETQEKSRVVSEIVSKGLPYKEIEAIINDNRVVVRLQTEKPSPFDPPCECIEPKSSETSTSQYKGGNEVIFQQAKEHCRTINVYPHPDQKTDKGDKSDKKDSKKGGDGGNINLPTVNPEDNPNIFVLKIKRKCENNDKKYNLDLEFRTPRPWRCKNVSS